MLRRTCVKGKLHVEQEHWKMRLCGTPPDHYTTGRHPRPHIPRSSPGEGAPIGGTEEIDMGVRGGGMEGSMIATLLAHNSRKVLLWTIIATIVRRTRQQTGHMQVGAIHSSYHPKMR